MAAQTFKSEPADAPPATIAEVEKVVASSKSQVVAEQRPPVAAGGGGQAYDGAVSIGGVGLQVVEGLAVLATIPAVLFARELWGFYLIVSINIKYQ